MRGLRQRRGLDGNSAEVVVRSGERIRLLDGGSLPSLPAEEARAQRGVSARSSGGDRTKKTGAKEIRGRKIFMTSSYVWFHWAVLSAVFASLTAIFAKIGLEGVDSDFATMIRTFIILFSIVGFVYYTGKWSDPRSLQPRTWIFLTLSGLATGASWVCYFRALQLGDAAKVAPVDKLSVLLVALFAVLFLGERPPLKDWLGICLVAAGVVVLGLRR
jgi:bacterial/archaeal transporter family protein